METTPLTADDEALVSRATTVCERTFDSEFFDGAHIVAAVRTADSVRVVPPCGTCRELLADYDLRVVVPVDGDSRVADAGDLLPTRTW